MARLAFEELDARIVTAVIATANVRSLALARRIGFREAHRSADGLLYTLSASDFRSVLERNAQLRGLIGSA
jgi:RimJ/RimL family protein N-acetyltransferase